MAYGVSWLEIVVLIAVWSIFALYVTPKLIAYFLSTRDLHDSPLADKLGSYFTEKIMSWASDPANRPKLDKVLVNVLQTEAAGKAVDQMVDYAKDKVRSMFEGIYGQSKKQMTEEISKAMPEYVSDVLDHPIVDKLFKALETIVVLKKGLGK